MIDQRAWSGYIKNMVRSAPVTTDYNAVRLSARRFLIETKPEPKQVCLLAGHTLDEGQEIAACAICDVTGCVECLDTHACTDYERLV